MIEIKERFDFGMVSVAELNNNCPGDVIEETIVRFSNSRLPQKASQNASNLGAVCCPAFSLS